MKELSTDQLLSELLKRTNKQISYLQKRAEMLQAFELVDDPKPKRQVKTAKRVMENDKPLIQRIEEVLSNKPDGMKIKDVLMELEASGWNSSASNKYSVVAVALAKHKNKFEKLEKGIYKLKDQLPLIDENEVK